MRQLVGRSLHPIVLLDFLQISAEFSKFWSQNVKNGLKMPVFRVFRLFCESFFIILASRRPVGFRLSLVAVIIINLHHFFCRTVSSAQVRLKKPNWLLVC